MNRFTELLYTEIWPLKKKKTFKINDIKNNIYFFKYYKYILHMDAKFL